MDRTQQIIAIISTIIGILATGVPFGLSLISKTKKLVQEKNWTKIAELLPELITEAEKFANYTGIEKKEYVKSKLAVYSVKNAIDFDEVKFEQLITDIVHLTRNVNKREKDAFVLDQKQQIA